MREYITKSGDLSPLDHRVGRSNLLGDLLGSFSEHDKIPQHGIADHGVREEISPAHSASMVNDAPTRIPHIDKAQASVTRHATTPVQPGREFPPEALFR